MNIMSEMQPLLLMLLSGADEQLGGSCFCPPDLSVLGEVLLAVPDMEASLLPTSASQTHGRASQQQQHR